MSVADPPEQRRGGPKRKQAAKRQPRGTGGNNGRGFGSRLSDEVQQKICDALQVGSSMESSCAHAGIAVSSFKDWMQKGRAQKTGRYAEFADAIDQALARAEVARVTRIAAAGQKGEWQADAWWLERVMPDRYGRKQVVQIGNEGGQPFRVDAASLDGASPERLAELERALLALRAEVVDADEADVRELGPGE